MHFAKFVADHSIEVQLAWGKFDFHKTLCVFAEGQEMNNFLILDGVLVDTNGAYHIYILEQDHVAT